MTVISIQPQVAFGHVGIAVPTTLLSNRPGYPTVRSQQA